MNRLLTQDELDTAPQWAIAARRECKRVAAEGTVRRHTPSQRADTDMLLDDGAELVDALLAHIAELEATHNALVDELHHIVAWGKATTPTDNGRWNEYRRGKVRAALEVLEAAGVYSPDNLPLIEGVTERDPDSD